MSEPRVFSDPSKAHTPQEWADVTYIHALPRVNLPSKAEQIACRFSLTADNAKRLKAKRSRKRKGKA